MAVKRQMDPAALLGDRITVSGLDTLRPDTTEWEAIGEMLESGTPRARIEKLREFAELRDRVNSLQARLDKAAGIADAWLLHDITAAEMAALYLAAAPSVIRDNSRQAGTRKERRPDITRWIDDQLRRDPRAKSPRLWSIAPQWLTDQIEQRSFARRVTARRKACK